MKDPYSSPLDSRWNPPEDHLATLSLPVSTCPECSQTINLTIVDRFYGHESPPGTPCPGSNHKRPTTAPIRYSRPLRNFSAEEKPPEDPTFQVTILSGTKKALRVTAKNQEPIWVPKSQITLNQNKLTIPRWMAIKRGWL